MGHGYMYIVAPLSLQLVAELIPCCQQADLFFTSSFILVTYLEILLKRDLYFMSNTHIYFIRVYQKGQFSGDLYTYMFLCVTTISHLSIFAIIR